MKYPEQESSTLEFKQQLPDSAKIIQTVIAFCNMYGGKIIVGVDDDGEIVGIAEREAHEAMEWLNKSIYETCAPPILAQIYLQHIHEKYLLIIDVSSGMQKPYYKKSQGLENGVYVRLGRSSIKADADLIEELKLQSRGIAFDQTPVHHASIDDLDPNKIELFLSGRRNGAKIIVTPEVLNAYKITVEQHSQIYPTVCGLLLFGRQPQHYLTEAYILCTHFSGIEGRGAISSLVCNGTLFEQFDMAYDYIVSRLQKAFTIESKLRTETLEIPAVAVREALMNALLHRNYHLNAPIKIAIYQNRIEIFSPGCFPGPMNTSELESGITYTRNVAIAKILWEFGYVEKMGSGLIAIFESYRQYGLEAPHIIEGTNYIKYILSRCKMSNAPPDEFAKIMSLLERYEQISRTDIITQLSITKSTAGRLINALIERGDIVRMGKGRNTYYKKK